MADNFISGNNLSIQLGGTSYSFGEWTFRIDGGTKKFFAAGSAAQRTLPGGYSGTVNAKGNYNQGNMPLAVQTVYPVVLGIDTGLSFTCNARLSNVEYHNAIEAGGTGMTCSIDLDTDGDFSVSLT